MYLKSFFEYRVLISKSIHLIGLTCLFIAIKCEETTPLKLNLMTTKIAHSKLTDKQILDQEIEILEKLGFELIGPTLLNFLEILIIKLRLNEIMDDKIYQVFIKLIMYNAMMVMYEYSMLAKYNYSLLCAAIILVAFKLLQKLQNNFNAGIFVKKLIFLIFI